MNPSTSRLKHNGLLNLHHTDIEKEPCVFTTARWDSSLIDCQANTKASCNRPCPIYLFEHHYTRLQVAKWAASCYNEAPDSPGRGRGPVVLLQALLMAVQQWHKANPDQHPESLRVKLRCFPGGRMNSDIAPIPRLPLTSLFPKTLFTPAKDQIEWTIALDTEPTEASEFTMYKTYDRRVYGNARKRANIQSLGETREVLLFTPQRQLLDASLSTPYFYRDSRWITPASSCGGQQGATRRWALENGLAVEGATTVDTMRDGEVMWLSNAVRGYFPALFIATSGSTSNGEDKSI